MKRFEERFRAAVGGRHAVAVNSATAALHLAVEALGLTAGQAVLVPTMTFAATAEVVRYLGALPVLVDCDPVTGNLDLDDASRKLEDLRAGRLSPKLPRDAEVVGIIPVHVGGLMLDMDAVTTWAKARGLWVVEDAAHAFPAAYRRSNRFAMAQVRREDVGGFLFLLLRQQDDHHGRGGNGRHGRSGAGGPDAVDVAPRPLPRRLGTLQGRAQLGLPHHGAGLQVQPDRHRGGHRPSPARESGRDAAGAGSAWRGPISRLCRDVEEIETPPDPPDRIHAWHLFPIRLRLERLAVDRNRFMEELKKAGVGCSVHWRPLHLHPYYTKTFGWRRADLPVATALWPRLVSLPIFPGMRRNEVDHVVASVRELCRRFRRRMVASTTGSSRAGR